MTKNLRFIIAFLLAAVGAHGQDLKDFKLYHPGEKATARISDAVKEARATNKHVLIQVGGNWCIWCARFHALVTADAHLDSLLHANYVVYSLNYSDENHNDRVLARYAYPQRFGFPVFLVLDGFGRLIHTQNSAYLEEGKGYSKEKVAGFLEDWSPSALDPKRYN